VENKMIKGMAHITGGGIPGNLQRILPAGCAAAVRKQAWKPLPIFPFLSKQGDIDEAEMFRAFNMGIGMALVVSKASAKEVLESVDQAGEQAWVIGEIRKGEQEVVLE
jgi:phosphoribosylformylglycinamidine cyclo-ligase